MSFGDALPEQKLAIAQASYDKAVADQKRAEKAACEQYRVVASARQYLEKVKREAAEAIPVDRSARQLSDGSPVTIDHLEINPATGQQKDYVVLAEEERAKGFVRPVRLSYVHLKCGTSTRMSQQIAETYARDPSFYGGTFCMHCGYHYPLVLPDGPRAFLWEDTNEGVGS